MAIETKEERIKDLMKKMATDFYAQTENGFSLSEIFVCGLSVIVKIAKALGASESSIKRIIELQRENHED